MTALRAVKKFSNSRLIMNSRWLWNCHQRHTFLRAEETRDILKFRVSEMAFPGVLKRYFSARMLCCFVRIHQDWEQCYRNVADITLHGTVQTFHRSKPV